MTSDEWMILLMGMALACGPVLLVWTEAATRAKGGTIPALITVKGYSVSPHTAFSAIIGIMLIFLSYKLRASGLGFVFMIFGFIDLVIAVQNMRRTRGL